MRHFRNFDEFSKFFHSVSASEIIRILEEEFNEDGTDLRDQLKDGDLDRHDLLDILYEDYTDSIDDSDMYPNGHYYDEEDEDINGNPD